MEEKNAGRCPLAAGCSFVGTFLLIVVILICIPMTVPKLFGYTPYAIISGSMEPAIGTGSLVYIRSTEPENIQENDVIAFYGGRDLNAITVHRVVKNQVEEKEFITKGDANLTEDINPVDYSQLMGRVEMSIPKAGYAAQILTGNDGKIIAVSIVGLAIVLHLLAVVLDRQREKDSD